MFTAVLSGQTNFRQLIENADPIPSDTILEIEAKLKIHQVFLDKASTENNILNQLFGNIYLFYDNIEAQDYIEAEKYLLEAKKIAESSENSSWKGWVNFRAGILFIRTNNVDEAISTFKSAIPLCRLAGDSLCIGESYEQLSIMLALAGDYEIAEHYFNLAIPLLKNYGKPKNLCTAYSNRGSVVSMKGKPENAIVLFEISIEFCGSIKRYDAQSSNINNLADAYRRLGKYDKAIQTYEMGLEFNKQHDFRNVMIKNYKGLYLVHNEKENYKLAADYLNKLYELKDSLMGVSVQEQVSSLEVKFDNQKKEIALQKSKTQLLEAQNYIRIIAMLFTFLFIISFGIFWYYYRKRQQMKLQIIYNKQNLRQLTQTLIRKNAGIKTLEDQLSQLSLSTNSKERIDKVEENLFDQKILTSDDWTAFKVNFDKAYSGYILKVRKSYALSEAEERLFLLLKLNLTRNEIASMLGVSTDSVKKTRSRLRKRLNLEPKESLLEFTKAF